MEMTTTTAETTAMDYGQAVKQAQRAAELLGTVLVGMRDEHAVVGLSKVTEHIAEAVRGLSTVRHTDAGMVAPTVAAANDQLAQALSYARERGEKLPPRIHQSMETVRRAIILLNGVMRHHGQAEVPPPLPQARPSAEPPPGVAERRRAPRAFLETEVSFESADNFYTGFTEDVSEGGLFLATYDLRPIGTHLEVEFTLPTGHIVRTEGEVRWVRDPQDEAPDAPPGMGIQFRELRPEDHAAIMEFIEARAPLFYED